MFKENETQIIESSQQLSPTEKKFLGTKRLHKGQKLFELNLKTGDVKLAEVSWCVRLDKTKKGEISVKEGYLYEAAINLENAVRKFNKKVDQMAEAYQLIEILNK